MKAMVKSVIDEMAAAIAASELPTGEASAGAAEMAAGMPVSELSAGEASAGATEMAAAHMTAARMCRRSARVSAAAVHASQSSTTCEREYGRCQRCVNKFHFVSPFHERADLPSCKSDTLPVVDIPAET
jgi:hypothetical protein